MDWNSTQGILRRGMSLERDGYNFYMLAAARAFNERGRAMFLDLASQEKDHLRLLLAEYRALEEGQGWLPHEEAMQADFPLDPTRTYRARNQRSLSPSSPPIGRSRWKGTSPHWSSAWRRS